MTLIVGNDPYQQPSFSFKSRVARAMWSIASALLFRPTPRILHPWRAFLLRVFGAHVGRGCHVYPTAKIWAPWNLRLGNHVGVADGAVLYNMEVIEIGDYAVISQGAHLCGGTHDYNSPNFQLQAKPIRVGAHAWICAEAFLHAGVNVPEGVVVGARSVLTRTIVEPWTVHAGNPARKVGDRSHQKSIV